MNRQQYWNQMYIACLQGLMAGLRYQDVAVIGTEETNSDNVQSRLGMISEVAFLVTETCIENIGYEADEKTN